MARTTRERMRRAQVDILTVHRGNRNKMVTLCLLHRRVRGCFLSFLVGLLVLSWRRRVWIRLLNLLDLAVNVRAIITMKRAHMVAKSTRLHMVATTTRRAQVETHMVDPVARSNLHTAAMTTKAPEIHTVDLAARNNHHMVATTTRKALETHTVDPAVQDATILRRALTKITGTPTVTQVAQAAETKRATRLPRIHMANPDVQAAATTKRAPTTAEIHTVIQVAPAVRTPRRHLMGVDDVAITRRVLMRLVRTLLAALDVLDVVTMRRARLVAAKIHLRVMDVVVMRRIHMRVAIHTAHLVVRSPQATVVVEERRRLRRVGIAVEVVRRLARAVVMDSGDMARMRTQVIDQKMMWGFR